MAMRRKLLIAAAASAGVLVVVLLTLPWWTGLVLRPALQRAGVSYAKYEARGYGQIRLEGIRWESGGTRVDVAQVDLPGAFPLAWNYLSNSWAGNVVVGEWTVVVGESAEDEGEPGESDWATVLRIGGWVRDQGWLPDITVDQGSVSWPGDSVVLSGAHWSAGSVSWTEAVWRGQKVDGRATFGVGKNAWRAELRGAADWSGLVTMAANDPWQLNVEAEWREQPIAGHVHFAPGSWVPDAASVRATDWALAGKLGPLDEIFLNLAGGVEGTWSGGKAVVTAAVVGQPRQEGSPPLDLKFGVAADEAGISVDRARVVASGVEASLDQPVQVDWAGSIQSGPANFSAKIDLDEFPADWELGGKLDAVVQVVVADSRPVASATVVGSALHWGDRIVHRLAAEFSWAEPTAKLTALELVTGDGDTLTGSGAFDVATRSLTDAELSGPVPRAWLGSWLPDTISWREAQVKVRAEGTWPDIIHAGDISAKEVSYAEFVPFDIELSWQDGAGSNASFTTKAQSEDWQLDGAGVWQTDRIVLRQLALSVPPTAPLKLAKAVTISWADEQLNVSPFALTNATGERLAGNASWGGADHHIGLDVAGVTAAWARAIWPLGGADWRADEIRANLEQKDGVFQGGLKVVGSLTLTDEGEVSFDLEADAGADKVTLNKIAVLHERGNILSAHGKIPMAYGLSDGLKWFPDGEIELSVATSPDSQFWEELKGLTGISVEQPTLNIDLSGTGARPTGKVEVTLSRGRWQPKDGGQGWPELRDLDVVMTADRSGGTIERFLGTILDQKVNAEGKLVLGDDGWPGLWHDPSGTLHRGTEVTVSLPEITISALAGYLPESISPTGKASAILRVSGGATVDGSIVVRSAATRPLGSLGSLQQIDSRLVFTNRTLAIERMTARAGGQEITIEGKVDWTADGKISPQLHAKGEDIPLVRKPGLLMRSDLDIHLESEGDEVWLRGTVGLRQSLFLSDIRSMIPKGGSRSSSAALRPPYFSVEQTPFASWNLDVKVSGDQFMRLRTPLLVGTASADFQLEGTLGEPRLRGEALIDEGTVRLPFANFTITDAWVRISASDPYEPQILLRGEGRRIGYDITMEFSGKASNPNLRFDSSPSLPAEDLLLLVMAGEAPKGEMNYSSNQRAVRLGTYLGKSLLTQFGGDPTRADRLTISTGEAITEQGRETYHIEYQIDDLWSAIGEYDEFDQYNVGIKRRISGPDPEWKPNPEVPR